MSGHDSQFQVGIRQTRDGTYHAVAFVLRIGLEDAVCGRVVTSGVHGVGPDLVEGGLFLLAFVGG
jgi:hypothetical protein